MRNAAMISTACFAVATIAAADETNAAARKMVSVAPQGLGPALQNLAKARNFQIVFVSEDVKGLQTQGAVGELTLNEALTQVLAGSGLTFRYLDDRTVTVVRPDVEPLSVGIGESGADRVFDIDIPATNAAKALERLAEQTGSEVRYSRDIARARQTNAVRGRFTLLEGLDLLLRNTGLSGGFSDKRVVIITENGNAPEGEGDSVKKRGLLAGLIAAVLGSQATDARADQEPEIKSNTQLQEIIVTAQKREERLQDVPISATVISGVDLDKSAISELREALTQTPGVTVEQGSLRGGQVSIRGVSATSSFATTGPSTVAFYLDGAPFGFVKSAGAPELGPYDLDRVEVLRGPQGTLYGANALNGVIRVLTKDPSFDGFDFKARLAASRTTVESDSNNYRGDFAVNLPLIEDKLALRAAVSYQDWAGFIDKPLAGKEDVNDSQLSTMRLKLRAQPTEAFSIKASAWWDRTEGGGGSIGTDDFTRNVPIDEHLARDYNGYNFELAYDFPSFTVTSATSFLDYAARSFLGVFVTSGITQDLLRSSDLFAQEINVVSTHEGPWRWSLGGLYRDAKEVSFVVTTIPPQPPGLGDADFASESVALFGELTYAFFDGRLELTGGARYFADKEVETTHEPKSLLPPNSLQVRREADFEKWTPRVILNWRALDDLMLYASYGQGFRNGIHQGLGTINSALTFGVTLGPAGPDTLHNYEIGAKGGLFDGLVEFDAALYYMDWQDSQQLLQIPFFVEGRQIGAAAAVINGESLSGLGVDAALTVKPLEGLELGAAVSWNGLAVDADIFSNSVILFEKGDRPSASAEWTWSARARYTFPLGSGGFTGHIAGGVNYVSEKFTKTLTGAGVRQASSDPITLGRASFAIETPDHWTLTLYAENINNEKGSPSIRPLVDPDLIVRIRPRTIGVQLEYKY